MRKWFNSLKVAQKLMLISIFFMMPDTFMLIMFITGINADIQFATLEQHGNEYQRPLEQLLDLIPQHRLLMQRARHGETAAAAMLPEVERNIDRAFDDLTRVDGRIGEELQFTKEGLASRGREKSNVRDVRKAWNQARSLDGNASDAAHLRLIADVRTMITHSGDMSNLILDPDLDSYYLMDVTLLALPQMQDRLAKVQSDGYAILHHDVPTGADQLTNASKLLTVDATLLREADLDRIISSTRTALNEDKNFYGISPTFQAHVPPSLAECIDATTAFIDLTRKLAAGQAGNLTAAQYLASGERARAASFLFWRIADQEVDTLLQHRIDYHVHRKHLSLSIAAMAFMMAVTLVTFITRSISRPLMKQARELEEVNKSLTAEITQRESVEAALRERTNELLHLALHDKLTGLSNRAMFNDQLADAVDRAMQESEYQYAVLFLDFDRFKTVNDSLGHEAGDQLLQGIADRLNAALPSATACGLVVDNALSARLGGDEFVVLVDGKFDSASVGAFAEHLLKTLGTPYQLTEHTVHSTVSIGITTSELEYARAEDVLRDADTAMYYAKAAGKARFVFFDRPMHAAATRRLELENDLRTALEKGEFELHYQPIVSLSNGALRGFESLVRWNHPQRGLIPPSEFIPVCEETGMIIPLGRWIVQEACRQLQAWNVRFPQLPNLTMSVNLSGRQLNDPMLVRHIQKALDQTKISPMALTLEITESVVISDADGATRIFNQIRALGVQLFMDDFGSGYSSLNSLQQFPLDGLKIDRKFIQNATGYRGDAAVVNAVVNLASQLGLRMIAEGIETAEQMAMLRQMGCELAQGYYFSVPRNAARAEVFIAQQLDRTVAA